MFSILLEPLSLLILQNDMYTRYLTISCYNEYVARIKIFGK